MYGRVRESRVLCQIFTSGRYFVAVYGAPTNTKADAQDKSIMAGFNITENVLVSKN